MDASKLEGKLESSVEKRSFGLGKNATGYLGQYPRDPITERQRMSFRGV